MNLGQIMQHVHQLPLPVDLLFAPQGKSFDTDGIVDVTEDRIDNAKAHAINVAAQS